MSKADWQQAMLNEAEATADAAWAADTRRAATFNIWQFSWGQVPPFLVLTFLHSFFVALLGDSSRLLLGPGAPGLLLSAALLVALNLVCGRLLYRYDIRSFLLIVFVVGPSSTVRELPLFQVLAGHGWLTEAAQFMLSLLLLTLPLALGYRQAYHRDSALI